MTSSKWKCIRNGENRIYAGSVMTHPRTKAVSASRPILELFTQEPRPNQQQMTSTCTERHQSFLYSACQTWRRGQSWASSSVLRSVINRSLTQRMTDAWISVWSHWMNTKHTETNPIVIQHKTKHQQDAEADLNVGGRKAALWQILLVCCPETYPIRLKWLIT